MLHPELQKWLGGSIRFWVAVGFLMFVWIVTELFWAGAIAGVIAYFRIAKPVEQLLGGGRYTPRDTGRYGERRFSFEEAETAVDEEAPEPFAEMRQRAAAWEEAEEEEEAVEITPAAAAPPRPMSSLKVPPRKPVDLPRRR